MFFNNKFNTFFGLNLTLVYTFPMCMTWRFHFPLRNYDFNALHPAGEVRGPASRREGMAVVAAGLARPQGGLRCVPVTGHSRRRRGTGQGEGRAQRRDPGGRRRRCREGLLREKSSLRQVFFTSGIDWQPS